MTPRLCAVREKGKTPFFTGGFVLINRTPPTLANGCDPDGRGSAALGLEGQKASENRLRLRTISRLGRLGFPPISRRRRVDGCLTTGEYSRNLGKRAFMLLMLQRE